MRFLKMLLRCINAVGGAKQRHAPRCIHKMQAILSVQVCEKYLANGKNVFWAFMDLEKAYDTVDRHGMWQMLRVYGVGGKLLKAVQSFYVDSRACVRVEMI